MNQPKKLIEVALPIKAISAESVRDKSIRHGHISTLHLWWARRPLPVCRAVVFASLVPDPKDEHCPQAFIEAIDLLITDSHYELRANPPYTQETKAPKETHKNKLLAFIGQFSKDFQKNEAQGKNTPSKKKLNSFSLIKWENRNNEEVLTIARKLIWVAHNATGHISLDALLKDFTQHYEAIKVAERTLYHTVDRHIPSPENKAKEAQLAEAIAAFLAKMPKVFDPFAGGGAIPLEAARLGCRAYGNDINPVAHIIQKGSLEFPQKYGKSITFSANSFIAQYGKEAFVKQQKGKSLLGQEIKIANRLAFDVEFYAKKLLQKVEEKVGHLYPTDTKGNKPIAYYWARTATCSNPTCGAEVPLLRQFYLANTPRKKVYLQPKIEGTKISFSIEKGVCKEEGWMHRANLTCPCCKNITDVKNLKNQFKKKVTGQQLIATITEGFNTKLYRLPSSKEVDILAKIQTEGLFVFNESMDNGNYRDLKLPKWGMTAWREMFTPRQLLTLQTFVNQLHEIRKELSDEHGKLSEYYKAVVTYLAILIDRIAIVNTSFSRWNNARENLAHPFSRQAIAMIFDYPESNPFCGKTGSVDNQLDWIVRYIQEESSSFNHINCVKAASGEKGQFGKKELDAVVTDPPYYDAIAYADLSDFFYVWLKRTLGEVYPLNFLTIQTPKADECTALAHHHGHDKKKAKQHFEESLKRIFQSIEYQTKGVVSIMFAHQSTEAWTTLCNSILGSEMNITGSWAMDTERSSRTLSLAGAALASSVTIACRPATKEGYGDYKTIKKKIKKTIKAKVEELYGYGFRGADLLTACFGQAVSEFGQYKSVEKANGDEVSVAELLELAQEMAFNAIVHNIKTDDTTRFYLGWLELFGFGKTPHDTARKVTQIGLNIDLKILKDQGILVESKKDVQLVSFKKRDPKQFARANNLINAIHQAMKLSQGGRKELIAYLAPIAQSEKAIFWRVLVALQGILPASTEDHKRLMSLLSNKDSLIKDIQASTLPAQEKQGAQSTLDF